MLIDNDLKNLASVAGVSQSSVANLSRSETINMDVILKIHSALECDIGDICEAVPKRSEKITTNKFAEKGEAR